MDTPEADEGPLLTWDEGYKMKNGYRVGRLGDAVTVWNRNMRQNELGNASLINSSVV
jgi:hypothetical protein